MQINDSDNENMTVYEEIPEEMTLYYDTGAAKKSCFFSLSVFQITLTLILTAVIFIMSFAGGFRRKLCEAFDYIQSFEIGREEIKNEISAMKSFLSDEND